MGISMTITMFILMASSGVGISLLIIEPPKINPRVAGIYFCVIGGLSFIDLILKMRKK